MTDPNLPAILLIQTIKCKQGGDVVRQRRQLNASSSFFQSNPPLYPAFSVFPPYSRLTAQLRLC
jgi:hypothetical protein